MSSIQKIILNCFLCIWSVLDGMNNEGKAFAVEALLILTSERKIMLSEAEKQRIHTAIKEDFPITYCQGCLYSPNLTFSQLFEERYYKKLLKRSGVKL
ncbi:MAG: hypothetical protein AAF740_03910 [Bacteroidota bacterium]